MMSNLEIIIGFSIISILLLVSMTCFIVFMQRSAKKTREAAQEAAKKIQKWSEEAEERRKNEAELAAARNGESEKKNFIQKIDLLIKQSGLDEKFPSMSVELFIALWASLVLASAGVTILFSRNIVVLLVVIAFAIVLPYVYVGFLSHRNIQKVQQMLIIFCDTAINISATATNLMDLLKQCAAFMDDPLRTALENAYTEAVYGTEGQWMALYHLRQRIPEKQFDSIIQDLELASKYEADYQQILKDRKGIIESHLASEAKKRQLLNSGRLNIAIMLGVCAYCVNALGDGLIEGGVWKLLTTNFIGIALLLMAAGIVLYAIKVCFTTPDL